LYGRENLGGVLGFFFLKKQIEKKSKKGREFDPEKPTGYDPGVYTLVNKISTHLKFILW